MTAQLPADPSQPLLAGGRAGAGGARTPLVQRHVPENVQTVLHVEALVQQESEGQLRPQASQVSRGASSGHSGMGQATPRQWKSARRGRAGSGS